MYKERKIFRQARNQSGYDDDFVASVESKRLIVISTQSLTVQFQTRVNQVPTITFKRSISDSRVKAYWAEGIDQWVCLVFILDLQYSTV